MTADKPWMIAVRLAETHGGDWQYSILGDQFPGTIVFSRFEPNRSGRQVLTGMLLLGEALTAEALRKIPIAAMEKSRNDVEAVVRLRDQLADLPPLRRTPGTTAEQFSALVAAHYKVWAAVVPNPVAAIAAEWKVKPATVHTWVREARLRGLLPPGARGKARS